MSQWLRIRIRLDRGIALLLLTCAAPVIAGTALLVVLTDGRPIFIRVARIGVGGREFSMWKIRTMRAGAPGGLAGGADLTAADDDRVTPTGRRLRRWRLDELPQLLNVIRGEMAVIGPRPEAPAYVDDTDVHWQRILQAPPGIAGATQVLVNDWEAVALRQERSHEVYRRTILPVKVALDTWYVEHATAKIDALIAIALVTSRSGRLRAHALRAVPQVTEIPVV